MEDFRNEKLEEGETWAKAEDYFIKIMTTPTIFHRLKVWSWQTNWEEGVEVIKKFYNNTKGMFNYIIVNEEFKKMLGYFLHISNILNGGDKKKG